MDRLPGPDGKPPKRRHPQAVEANRPHKWSGGGQPDWLNTSNGGRICMVCGVTEYAEGMGTILADHAGFGADGKLLGDPNNRIRQWTYEDAKGNRFQSTKQLGCPVFILDPVGMTVENRGMLREVDDRVDHAEDRIDTVEDRITRLESELAEARAQQADVTAFVKWLGQMAAIHLATQQESTMVTVGGQQVALPPPVANLILDVAALDKREPVKVLRKEPLPVIEAEFEED